MSVKDLTEQLEREMRDAYNVLERIGNLRDRLEQEIAIETSASFEWLTENGFVPGARLVGKEGEH